MTDSAAPNRSSPICAPGSPSLMLGIRNARTTDTVRIAASTGHHAILVDLEHSHDVARRGGDAVRGGRRTSG